jgi:hypothetical protein
MIQKSNVFAAMKVSLPFSSKLPPTYVLPFFLSSSLNYKNYEFGYSFHNRLLIMSRIYDIIIVSHALENTYKSHDDLPFHCHIISSIGRDTPIIID